MPLRLGIAIALVAALLPAVSVLGLVSTTITIDGNLDDWSGVLASAENAMSDPIGTADPDDPGTANRDLNLFAYTWDTDNVYVFVRRTASGSNSVHYIAAVDVDADGMMTSADRMVDFDFNGSVFQANTSGVYQYSPSSPLGDPLGGDGDTLPGTLGTPIAATPQGASAADGIRHECAIPWTALGVPDGSPVAVKMMCSLNTNLPTSVQDNTNAGSLVLRQATLSAGTTKGGLAGGNVSFTHTLQNTGNIPDTYSVLGVSSRGWPMTVTDGSGNPLSSVTLAVGATLTVRITETIPPATADGVRDTVTLRVQGAGGFPVLTARDITVAGEVIVIPDLVNSLAPGNVSVFHNTLMNNSEETVALSLGAASNKGYAVALFASDGVTPLSQVVVPSGGSLPIQVHVTIPAGAPLGTADLTTLRAVAVDDTSVQNSGVDTTNIRAPVTITPNNAGAAGSGTQITYLHTVTNSTTDTRTVDLGVAGAWPAQLLAADGVTAITSVTLPPFGGSADIRVRVTVPEGTTAGTANTTTVSGTSGAYSASATDVTTVSTLVLFADGAYTQQSDEYLTAETVHVRGSALTAGSNVRFRWLNPSGTVVFTSADVPVDVGRQATSSYTIPSAGPVGTWTCVVVNTKGAELGRRTFYVGFRGHIGSLIASDVSSGAGVISARGEYVNDGGAAITGSSVGYLVWYDVDTDGVCSNGDLYVDAAGDVQTYAGTGTESTHVSAGFTVPASGTWSEPSPWTLPAANLPYPGTYHVTATWLTSDGRTIGVRDTTFQASIYRITLSISDTSMDAGPVDPDVTVPVETISLSVDANSPFDLYKVVSGDAAVMGLSTTLANQFGQPSGIRVYSDSYSVTVPWTTDPGPLNASVTYTVVAQ